MSRRAKPAESTDTTTNPTSDSDTPAGNQRGNRPLRVFRARSVSVAVFENVATIEGREVKFLKAELRRVYRDGEQFRTTHAFSVNDLPVARLLLERAFAFMLEAGQDRAEADDTPAREGDYPFTGSSLLIAFGCEDGQDHHPRFPPTLP